VAGAGPVDGGEELRVPVDGHEAPSVVECIRLDAPGRLPPEQLGGHVGHGFGREGAADAGLLVTPGAVVRHEGVGDLDPAAACAMS
jgi:hypothetical protein